ncbi:MAG: metallophosphoesterase [Phycisphaerales bacterium]|nr:MAG: metallophosphoesterase [Phycisphaerales bacterium]
MIVDYMRWQAVPWGTCRVTSALNREAVRIGMRNTLRFVCAVVFCVVSSSRTLAEEPWRFIVTGDSRGSDNGVNRVILDELVVEILSRDVEFVLFSGDLVYGIASGAADEFETQLRTWLRATEPVYDANIGVYVCRGNHELGDLYRSPLPGTDPNHNYAGRWLDIFGSDDYPDQKLPDNGPVGEKYMTYSVRHRNVFVACLDNYAGLGHSFVHRVNQRWLDLQLASNASPHVFLMGHEPAFRALPRSCLEDHPADRDAFWMSIKNAGGRTYFCGHDHFYDHARIDDGDGDPNNDVHQYIVGAGGAYPYTWSPPYNGDNTSYSPEQVAHAKAYGYVIVEIDDLDVTLTWMERDSLDLDVAGVYEPNEVWSYTVVPGLIIVSPNGGERLLVGDGHTISWSTIGGAEVQQVLIEYSLDEGRSWKQVDSWPNTGSYAWDSVPLVDSDECLIRISDLSDATLSDTSDDVFTIVPCEKHLAGDLNGDCYVDLRDLAIFMADWLDCGHPLDPSCSGL